MRLLSRRPVGGGATGMGQAVPGSVGANVVAIDNKIEQAMDLVKTHLLYAVREEVEVLKEKIIDLEKKVFRLETENKLLREYAPPEILQQIQHQHHPQSQAALVNSQTNNSIPSTTAAAPAPGPATTASAIPAQVQQSHPAGPAAQSGQAVSTQHSVQGSQNLVNSSASSSTTTTLSSTSGQQGPH